MGAESTRENSGGSERGLNLLPRRADRERIMKFLPTTIAAIVLASGVAFSGAQDPQGALEGRVADLEAQLALERERHDETRVLLENALVYLEKQAENANRMMSTLERSEAEGFTAGINFRSREILLQGWRELLRGQEKGVPKPPKPTGQGQSPQNG